MTVNLLKDMNAAETLRHVAAMFSHMTDAAKAKDFAPFLKMLADSVEAQIEPEPEAFKPYNVRLSIRETRKYVDSYRHLDSSRYVTTAEVQHRTSWITDSEDMCEPTRAMIYLRIVPENEVPDEDIKQALYDTFNSWGCGHEHDCCGCWNTSVSKAVKLDACGHDWIVVTHSIRNY